MKSYVERYTKIAKSTTSGKDSFRKALDGFYNSKPETVNLRNNDNDKFILYKEPIFRYEKAFNVVNKKALSYRSVSLEDYLASGYLTSEINSSLKAEGVNSSRKMVDSVLKQRRDGTKLSKDDLTKLISNFYDAFNFILSQKEINARNIFTLYSILTSDINEDIIEEGSQYRRGDVSIGEDVGADPKTISDKMNELILWINSDIDMNIQTKAIVAHYVFENIHPYYDYNGRMGRLLHLWILFNTNIKEFWRLTFLSEAVYAFKQKLDSTFRRIVKAKKSSANIDLTYFVGRVYEILIEHTEAYNKMKELTNKMKTKPSRHIRLFIIDILCINGADDKWYDINEFKRRYPDYTPNVYGRVIKEIRESNLFEIRDSKPIQFRIIK